jgi:arabinose-5-phosphate isomerase
VSRGLNGKTIKLERMMDYIAQAQQVIDLEMEEVQHLRNRLGAAFNEAVQRVLDTLKVGRKLIICGVGKSGNIASKLVATLNSTGATAVALNAQDALHGDLGVIDAGDLAILLSYSGETQELLLLLPHLRRLDLSLIAITGGLSSTLAQQADVVLDVQVRREACPLNLAPTSSTTTMLVLCDALAMVLLEARGFKSEDFAQLHPGGSLGRMLLTRARDVMRSGAAIALISPACTVQDALQGMTRARAGAAIVVDAEGRLLGVFTQGDFVRAYQQWSSI